MEVSVLTVYRLKYKRDKSVEYVAHLDTIQVFSRACRRAGIPVAYSQGFNPKPSMVFGAPAAMGMTSDSEIMDIELNTQMQCDELKATLNANLPSGFRVLDCRLKETKSNIMALVKASSYEIKLSYETSYSRLKKVVEDIMTSTEVVVPKKTKSGINDTNIRNMIYYIQLKGQDEEQPASLSMMLTSGNEGSLKPELLMGAMNKIDPDLKAEIREVHRTGMYVQGDDGLVDPLSQELRWKLE
jgi:radical SAM-linked protein